MAVQTFPNCEETADGRQFLQSARSTFAKRRSTDQHPFAYIALVSRLLLLFAAKLRPVVADFSQICLVLYTRRRMNIVTVGGGLVYLIWPRLAAGSQSLHVHYTLYIINCTSGDVHVSYIRRCTLDVMYRRCTSLIDQALYIMHCTSVVVHQTLYIRRCTSDVHQSYIKRCTSVIVH